MMIFYPRITYANCYMHEIFKKIPVEIQNVGGFKKMVVNEKSNTADRCIVDLEKQIYTAERTAKWFSALTIIPALTAFGFYFSSPDKYKNINVAAPACLLGAAMLGAAIMLWDAISIQKKDKEIVGKVRILDARVNNELVRIINNCPDKVKKSLKSCKSGQALLALTLKQ